jgi:hypothetical protein
MDTEQEVPALGTVNPPTFNDKLAALVETDNKYRYHKKAMEEAKELLDLLKREIMAEFEYMGIDQIKTRGKTLYIAHQIWAGNADGTIGADVADELQSLGLGEFVSYNHMSFSAYVRETARQHPELINAQGEIIGTEEQILGVLPGNLPTLCRITDKADIKIRKG